MLLVSLLSFILVWRVRTGCGAGGGEEWGDRQTSRTCPLLLQFSMFSQRCPAESWARFLRVASKPLLSETTLLQPCGEHVLFPCISSMTYHVTYLSDKPGSSMKNGSTCLESPWKVTQLQNSMLRFNYVHEEMMYVAVLVNSGCHN